MGKGPSLTLLNYKQLKILSEEESLSLVLHPWCPSKMQWTVQSCSHIQDPGFNSVSLKTKQKDIKEGRLTEMGC